MDQDRQQLQPWRLVDQAISGVSAGTILATGLPRFVINTVFFLAETSSMT
jgi:hypothetical protein